MHGRDQWILSSIIRDRHGKISPKGTSKEGRQEIPEVPGCGFISPPIASIPSTVRLVNGIVLVVKRCEREMGREKG